MKCNNCGNELPESSQFCNKCGTKTHEPAGNKKTIIIVSSVVTVIAVVAIAAFIFLGKGNDNVATLAVDQQDLPKAEVSEESSPTPSSVPVGIDEAVDLLSFEDQQALYESYLRDVFDCMGEGMEDFWWDWLTEDDFYDAERTYVEFHTDGLFDLYVSGAWINAFLTIVDGEVMPIFDLYVGDDAGESIASAYDTANVRHVIVYNDSTEGTDICRTYNAVEQGSLHILDKLEYEVFYENDLPQHRFLLNGQEVTQTEFLTVTEKYTQPVSSDLAFGTYYPLNADSYNEYSSRLEKPWLFAYADFIAQSNFFDNSLDGSVKISLVDIDGNGIEELIYRGEDPNGNGSNWITMFTWHNGEVVHIFNASSSLMDLQFSVYPNVQGFYIRSSQGRGEDLKELDEYFVLSGTDLKQVSPDVFKKHLSVSLYFSNAKSPSDAAYDIVLPNGWVSDYVFFNSQNTLLNDNQLYGLSKDELRIARNEIFARHGRQFNDEGLQEYFNSKEWYQQIDKLPIGTEPTLNDTETANAALIRSVEERYN